MTTSTDSMDLMAGTKQSCASIDPVFRKISRRLIPLLFLIYVMANMDRVNIGIAQLQMKTELGFTDAMYGLGAGIFFLSYGLFELPSSMLMARIGALRTMTLLTGRLGTGVVSHHIARGGAAARRGGQG